jgi:hypothetical protein
MPRSTADYRWTQPKIAEFLRHLRLSGSVTAAARQVGMSRQSAYVRSRTDRDFANKWDSAVAFSPERMVAAYALRDSVK